MKAGQRTFLVVLLLVIAGCNSGSGPDSLYNFTPPTGCVGCHNSSVSPDLDPLVTNGSGSAGKHFAHVAFLGLTCDKCHFNYLGNPAHFNGVLNVRGNGPAPVYFDVTNPLGVWSFVTPSGPGTCSNTICHKSLTPDWYGLAVPPQDPVCSDCHNVPVGTRRQVLEAAGDFASNPTMSSHHVSGASDPAPDQCRVCHEMSKHMGGTVQLKNADTGAAIVYNPAAPASLEPFCLSCHDTDGSQATFITGGTPTSPFNDGSIMGQAPNRASAEINDAWNKTYGHRQQGLTCIGNGAPNTGCHGNGHGSVYKGILARNVTLPQTKHELYSVGDEPDYALCFGCHASYERVSKEAVLGMRPGGNYALDLFARWGVPPPYSLGSIQTLFRDVNLGTTGKPYDDFPVFGSAHENLHLFHLQIGPNTWNYRDLYPSSIVCLSCHSVHGSNTQWGWVYDTILFDHHAGIGTDQYGQIGAPLATLGNYPTSCAFNCHGTLGTTSSWFEPSDE